MGRSVSFTTRIAVVIGPCRAQFAPQPLNNPLTPSRRYISVTQCQGPVYDGFMNICVFTMSTGAVTVVVTSPAIPLTARWVPMLSFQLNRRKKNSLTSSYVAHCEAVRRLARAMLGVVPFHSARRPSSRKIRAATDIGPGRPFAMLACMCVFTMSVGLHIAAAMAPLDIPAAIFTVSPGSLPLFTANASLNGVYRPMRRPAIESNVYHPFGQGVLNGVT